VQGTTNRDAHTPVPIADFGMDKGHLLLEDRSIFQSRILGFPKTAAGEVVIRPPNVRKMLSSDRFKVSSRLLILTVCILICDLWGYSHAQVPETYYVNPDDASCNDEGAGTNQATPWCSAPGTRNSANTAYINTHVLACGDTILLCAGSTHDSSDGGRLTINSLHYTDCGGPTQNPITLRIATSGDNWPGCDGPGSFTMDGTGITAGPALLVLFEVDRVHVRGSANTASGRIVIRNSNTDGILIENSNRVWLHNFQSANHNGQGVITLQMADVLVQDGEVNANTNHIGISVGAQVDGAGDRVALIGIDSHNNGRGTNCPGTGGNFQVTGCDECWFIDIQSYDGECEGWSSGVIFGPGVFRDQRIQIRNAQLYVNNSNFRSNLILSGDQNLPDDGYEHIATLVRGIFYGAGAEGWSYPHGGGVFDCWHCIAYANGFEEPFGGSETNYDRASDWSGLHNSIIYKRDSSGFAAFTATDASGGSYTQNRPFRVENTTVVGLSLTQRITNFDFACSNDSTQGCQRHEDCSGGTCDFSGGEDNRFDSPPDFLADEPTVTITMTSPAFTAADLAACGDPPPYPLADYNTCDFALSSEGDPAVDAGRCFMLTTNSGTNSTGPINVEINSPDAGDFTSFQIDNPRRFFYVASATGTDPAASFYAPLGSGIAADPIQIGSSVTRVAGLTSTSITVNDSISWSSGACVHFPYPGLAPDRGF